MNNVSIRIILIANSVKCVMEHVFGTLAQGSYYNGLLIWNQLQLNPVCKLEDPSSLV